MAELPRRAALLGAASVLAAATSSPSGPAAQDSGAVAWDYAFPSIDEGLIRLRDYAGDVLLVVNTASFCGYTPQYKGLQTLHEQLSARGLAVIGVPSQDFRQENDSNQAVRTFCETYYGVTFPLAAISHVRGPEAQAFYLWVDRARHWQPSWNFNKVLVGRDGRIAGTFGSDAGPESAELRGAIDAALAARA